MSKSEFINVLAEREVPYVDLSEEELRRQVEAAMPRWARPGSVPSRTAEP